MKYNTLIIDLDNTLIDFDLMEENSLKQAFEKNGISYSKEMLDRYYEINVKMWKDLELGLAIKSEIVVKRFEILFKEYGIDVSPSKINNDYLSFMPENIFYIDGAKKFLETIKNKYTNILMTNGLIEVQKEKIKRLSLDDYFDHIIISGEVGYEKPNIKIYEYMEKLTSDLDKNKVLAIGDSLSSDIKGGENYGVDTCWFNKNKKKKTSNATYEIDSLYDLINIINS